MIEDRDPFFQKVRASHIITSYKNNAGPFFKSTLLII